MLNIPRSLLLVPLLLSYRAASANPSQAPSLPYHHLLHPPTLTPAQTTLSQPGAVASEQRPGAISTRVVYLAPRDTVENLCMAAGAEVSTQEGYRRGRPTFANSWADAQDTRARRDFKTQISAIVEDVMREEMDRIARNISEQAVSLLTDQLLLFTMRGQRYLCLNAVRTLASKFDASATCKVAVLITRQTDTA